MSERIKIGHLNYRKCAVTSVYNLKAKYIIHTTVQSWKNNLDDETEQISECYY